MVGAAGPLRTGDEVDFLLPPSPPGGKPQKASAGNPSGGRRAVGTVRVQVGAGARKKTVYRLDEYHTMFISWKYSHSHIIFLQYYSHNMSCDHTIVL